MVVINSLVDNVLIFGWLWRCRCFQAVCEVYSEVLEVNRHKATECCGRPRIGEANGTRFSLASWIFGEVLAITHLFLLLWRKSRHFFSFVFFLMFSVLVFFSGFRLFFFRTLFHFFYCLLWFPVSGLIEDRNYFEPKAPQCVQQLVCPT